MGPQKGIAIQTVDLIQACPPFHQFESVKNRNAISENRPHGLVEEGVVHFEVKPRRLVQNKLSGHDDLSGLVPEIETTHIDDKRKIIVKDFRRLKDKNHSPDS